MNIAELQELILYAISTGVFMGFIIGTLLIFFGKAD